MLMGINGSYNHYKTGYAEQLKSEQEKVKETEKGQNDEQVTDKILVPHDQYISSEKPGAKPIGLYWVGQDENGKRKIVFDDPKKSGNTDGNEQPKVKPDNSEKPAEKCTVNTNKVDREIKKLKEKQQELEQQIKSALGDEKKVKELEKKLAQVESELSQKNNDIYRRQHAFVSA